MGLFFSNDKYKLYLNYKSFELKLEAPLLAVQEKNNFPPFYIKEE